MKSYKDSIIRFDDKATLQTAMNEAVESGLFPDLVNNSVESLEYWSLLCRMLDKAIVQAEQAIELV